MKILQDLVAIQSISKERGIGRYTYNLAKEILNLTDDEVISMFSKKFDISLTNKEEFKNYTTYTIEKNTLITEALQDSDIIHLHSVIDDTIDMFDTLQDIQQHTVITLYDLIPLIFKEHYLKDENSKRFYFQKLKLLYEADRLLAISQATKKDAIDILGISEDKVINVGAAIDTDKFYKLQNPDKSILNKYNITQPFILYTGGLDFRKNIDFSIKAFKSIEKKLYDSLQYVIVCSITKDEQNHFDRLLKELNIKSSKVVFTNFTPDEDLNVLYNLTELFIFPSIYEGFGLPIVEAMSCGAIVIGANNSSIPNIIDRDDLLFDLFDIDDLATKISYILNDKKLQDELKNYSEKRSKDFSWFTTAQKTIDVYKSLNTKKKILPKQSVAFFTPLPPKRSGISDYSAELLPFLSKYFEIDIYIDGDYVVEDDYVKYNFNIYDYHKFEDKKDKYKHIIYQFGNSDFHQYMYDISLKYSGIVLLHDFYLSGLVDCIATKNADLDFFIDTLEYSHPNYAHPYVQECDHFRLDIVKVIDTMPLNKKIIDNAKAIIVHSKYSQDLFKHYYPNDNYNIFKVHQSVKIPLREDKKAFYKKYFGFSEDTVLVSAFGYITQPKQYDFIIEAFAKASIFKDTLVKLVFVGDFLSHTYKLQIQNLIKKYNFENNIFITGFVSDDEYKNYLKASDVGINLRVNSRGETSRALLMNMAYSLPTIINDYATFSEYSDEVTSKVILNSQEDFILKLKELITDKDKREKMSQKTYDYIRSNHNLDLVAEEYFEVLRECLIA